MEIREAKRKDAALILRFVRELAAYEKMEDEVCADAAIAVRRGCKRLEWSCLDWNEKSIGFYRSLGAQPMSDWTVYRAAGDTLWCLAQKDTEAGGREDGTRLP